MARVLLLSTTPPGPGADEQLAPLRALQQSATCDRHGVHSLADNPETADVILFVEAYGAGWYFESVRRHPITRRHREKCFLFCANTLVIPFLPGIYTGIDRRWTSRRTISGFYVGAPENEFATCTPPHAELPYLFSFVGSTGNAAVRGAIARLSHPRGLVLDSTADYARVLERSMSPQERSDYHRRYAEITQQSKFVLCPRGLSVSSIRLFETMQMGRVPVILSDDWGEPPGPLWEEFSVRVPEQDCARLPQILEAREHEAFEMGKRARQEWLQWFSEESAFHTVAEWCLSLQEQRTVPERFARWPVYLQYLRPFHFRRALGMKLRGARQALRPGTR
ncbi:hypothetical protein BH20VER2_BH20VER2_16400 [soil metagenome]